MKAVEINQYGSSDVLHYKKDVAKPKIGCNDVLVHNKATSVNPIDIAKREGYGKPLFELKRQENFPWIMGNDVAGVIVEVGSNVTRFKTGDEVFGALSINRQGAWAEYITIAEDEIAFKPTNISFEEAGAIPYVALTTWAALIDKAKLNQDSAKRKKVLVHAGSGGVGTFAIQLLKAFGYYVATTCSTDNIDLVKSLGADEIIDYSKEDYSCVLKDFDVVYDTLGSNVEGNEEKSIATLKGQVGAVYVSIVHPMLSLITENGLLLGLLKVLFTLLGKKIKNRGISYQWSLFKPNGKALEQIKQLIEAGKIKPVIDRTYTLEQMKEAHDYIANGHAKGKVAITL